MVENSTNEEKNTSRWGTIARLVFGIALVGMLAGLVVVQFRKTGESPFRNAGVVAPIGEDGYPESPYREVAQVATGLQQSTAIALDRTGHLYAAGDRNVIIFDSQWKRQASFSVSDTSYCLTVGVDGHIYLGMRDHVEVYSRGGEKKASWASLGGRARLTSLAVTGTECWAGDAGNRVVWRLDHTGKVLGEIGKRDSARKIPGLVVPSAHLDVAAGSTGYLLVANPGRHLIETYTTAGERVEHWGETSMEIDGFTGCCNPTDIALFPDGRVATAEKGIPRVKVYGVDGSFKCMVAAPQELSKGASGLDLAIDGKERIYVLDPGINAVRIFSLKNESKP